ncbi:HsdR family type I site-specific deoxyribonuclease [Desulfovibrio sp. OttesenSCG-928-A18]|nr:HsdR family type I site-specific deoxyribonuclease [Desulfovibrio sp. OttesenSCG-928-A18]
MHSVPNTSEEYIAKIPALQLLMAMGWRYMPPAECLQKRGSNREVILREELIAFLQTRRFEFKGSVYPLSTNAIDQIVREVATPSMQEGLLTANERMYEKLCLGVTVTEFVDGQKVQPTISLIDWSELEAAHVRDCSLVLGASANRYVVTEEMEVLRAGGISTRRPDMVCFVNGLPLVVIEGKKPESGNPNKSMIDEGVSQNIRNQKHDEIPQLFVYSQLLLSISGTDGKYGTTKTSDTFWQRWREEEIPLAEMERVKKVIPSQKEQAKLFAWREDGPAMQAFFKSLWARPMQCNEQDILLSSLLSPARLLEIIRYFLLFDRKKGKVVARYPQMFGVKRMVERVRQRKSPQEGGGRQGGVIWHTTGSGKSLTMVFLCKAMLLHPLLRQCRIIVVTDRINLEKQLAGTFLDAGAYGSAIARKEGEKSKALSGKDLAKRIGKGQERILFTLVQKFNTAAKLKECYNPSEDIIVLIDEAHSSQGGETHERMRAALPHAAYIGFTGTPLLKKDKTVNKFGPIIHAYTMQRAVQDEAVRPLIYEERKPELDVNQKAIDDWFELITEGLSEEQKADIKRKYDSKDTIYGSDNRIARIAWDIAKHFKTYIRDTGLPLKAQLATDSKISAIRYKQHLDATGWVTSAVVISPPDTREGNKSVDEDDESLPLVQQWYKKTVGNKSPQDYEREIIDDFADDGPPDILIVVDKLLTGFDEPRNGILYIDKPLEGHNVIQAIARVNRLHPDKEYGLLIDYRGILAELDTAVTAYQNLEERTQGGYDIDDLKGLYHQVNTEYKRLPALHEALWGIFADVKNKKDLQQFRQVLMPQFEAEPDAESESDLYDVRQKVREDFYLALSNFDRCLRIALSSRSFYEDGAFDEATVSTYKRDLAFFISLRKIARRDAQETVDYSDYEEPIRNLVDKHVIAEGITVSEEHYLVDELGVVQDPQTWTKEKLRNETDIIKSRVRKSIDQELASDPYAQKFFSQLLKEAIARADEMFNHPYKQFALFQEFEERLRQRRMPDMPEVLQDKPAARSFFGIFRMEVGNAFEDTEAMVQEALAAEEIVSLAVAENSLNPQDIEAEITKGLLPRLYKLLGLEQAKAAIEKIIKVTRYGRLNEAKDAGGK